MTLQSSHPRWRFTLRGLLVCLSVIGVLLGIGFSRWQESRTLYLGVDTYPMRTLTVTTTYRRGWLGRRVKHGRQHTLGYDGKLLYESFYNDGELVLERSFDPPGVLAVERSYRP